MPASKLRPKPVLDSGFKYEKVFGDGKFIASGVVYIPVGKMKPNKPAKDNSYVRTLGLLFLTAGLLRH